MRPPFGQCCSRGCWTGWIDEEWPWRRQRPELMRTRSFRQTVQGRHWRRPRRPRGSPTARPLWRWFQGACRWQGRRAGRPSWAMSNRQDSEHKWRLMPMELCRPMRGLIIAQRLKNATGLGLSMIRWISIREEFSGYRPDNRAHVTGWASQLA